MNKNHTFRFGAGNAKLDKGTATFSLPVGWTCPFASLCKTRVSREGKMIEGGKVWRCYAATQELIFPNSRKARWHNFNLAKRAIQAGNIVSLLNKSLPKGKNVIRLHVAGDFFSQAYFNAWLEVARINPDKVFYAYTKSLGYWVSKKEVIPSNFKLIASKGGKLDYLIPSHDFRFAEVVMSEDEALKKHLRIVHSDFDIYGGAVDNVALLIHGSQPKGTEAAKQWDKLHKAGKSGYRNKRGYGMERYNKNKCERCPKPY